jgi:hypothetical protein
MIAITAVLFISAVSFVFYNNKDTLQTQAISGSATVLASSEQPFSDLEKDADGDGLADWEEILWSTDPNNADTDGDGVRDKEQVLREKRLATNSDTSALSLQVQPSDDDLTLTEIASRELFGSYMYSLQTGQTPTVADQEVMANNAIKKIVPLLPESTFTVADVHTMPATQENRIRYAKSLQSVFTNIVANVSNEAESLFKLAHGNRAEAIAELAKTASQYQEYINEMKTVSVPEDAANLHATVISTFEDYVYVLEGFSYFESDPMRSAVSIQMIQISFAQMENSFKNLAEYIVINRLYGLSPAETNS